jgi:Cu(I)-responsive transcriptional regulator
MQIGAAAAASGVTAKMIRHYESIGLIPSAGRRDSNYRDYGAADVHRLGFIRRARDLGFAMDEIRDLLKLWGDRERSSADVKALTLRHIAELEEKIAALEEMRDTLSHLADCCDGDHRPDCPIIKGLEGTAPLPKHHHHHRAAEENLRHAR